MQSLDRDIELNFDQADRRDPSHFPAFVFRQEFSGWNVFGWAALEEAEDGGQYRAADRTEDVDVSRLAAWLGRYVRHTVATDDIATQIVSLRKSQLDLGPAGDIVRSVADFEREVPNDSPIGLLALVCVLTHATFISLLK